MHRLRSIFAIGALCAAVLFFPYGAHAQTTISGAGATFPFPLYAKWAAVYAEETGVRVNFQSIGSGGGIQQIRAETIDFGASDTPLKPAALEDDGLIQFPTVMGGVVPVINLPGVVPGQLKLTPQVLADLFSGIITQWDDPRIVELNPDVNLPSLSVTVVHRADASGTTWIFTNYLSKTSLDWANRIGNDMAVAWPAGVGGKGNEGVASYVSRISGAIGYVEYAYALQNEMTHVMLRNRAGQYVEPNNKTFQAAAAHAQWQTAPGFYMILTDQPGDDSWPIVGATFILLHKVQSNPRVGHAVLRFFDWCYRNGDAMASELHYVPLPDEVVSLVRQYWQKALRGPNGDAIWPTEQ